MSTSLGEAVLDLSADNGKLEGQLDKTKKGVEGTVSKIEGAFKAVVASAVLQMIAKTYKELISAGEEAAVTEAKVAGVIRATGNAAGYTVDELGAMADEFSRITGFDDEVIMNAEAVLLTFRQIGKEVFPDTMQAAIDMAAVLDQDLKGSILSVGKAMNDFSGYTILKKQGVSFSEEQIKQIEHFKEINDLVGYQELILAELQGEFGNTAQAMEEASTGGKRLEVSVGNLKEEIGKGMIPQQREWNLSLAETLDKITASTSYYNEYRDAVYASASALGYEDEAVQLLQHHSTKHREEIERNAKQIMLWTEIGNAWEQRLAAEGGLVGDLAAELKEVDYKTLLDLTMNLSKENQNYAASQEAVRAKIAENKLEIDALIAQGYSPMSEKVQELWSENAKLGLKYDENAVKHREATNKILYDLFLQKISVDGVTDAEYEMALQAGLALGQIDQEAIDTARNFDLVAQAVADGKLRVEDMQAALDMLPTYKNIDVVINALVRTASDLVTGHDQGDGGMMGGYAEGTGGWLEVPAGYPNDSYPIMVSSGELFSVIPNGGSQGAGMSPGMVNLGSMDLGGGGGMGGGVQFVYSPMISTADEYEARRVLGPFIEGKVREMSKR